jgi:phosphomannomutase
LNADYAIDEITKEWSAKGARVNTQDGVRIDGDDFWVHMRKSNTEPIVRVIGEAHTAQKAKEICEEFMDKIQTLGKA